MSPKPVDVRRALETLRGERLEPEITERALRAIHHEAPPQPSPRGGRRSIARPLTFAMITTALAVVVFMPRAKAGAAWAQTLAVTAASPHVHLVSRWPSGKVASEEWRSGVKRATVLYNSAGRPIIEMRNDGKRALNYSSSFAYAQWKGVKPSPNAREYALVSRAWRNGAALYEVPIGEAKVALNDPDVKVMEHREATGASPETYRLRRTIRLGGKPLGRPQTLTAEVDADSGRIVALVDEPAVVEGREVVYRTQIDYPASIPASIFEARPQAVRDVDVYDNEKIAERVQHGVRDGLARKGPVTLRAVVVDASGDLWAFWTGALPDPKLPHPFSAPGVKLGGAFTNKIYTTAWRQSPKMNGAPVSQTGPRIGGMGRTTLSKLGPTVDLDVPYPGGVARFKNVPYVRVGYVQHVSSILGAKRDYR